MFSQYYPGSPQYPYSTKDGIAIREKYFHQCLLRVAKIPNLESVACNWRIGCGIRGGNWEHYLGMLVHFENYVEKQGAKVAIYKRIEDD